MRYHEKAKCRDSKECLNQHGFPAWMTNKFCPDRLRKRHCDGKCQLSHGDIIEFIRDYKAQLKDAVAKCRQCQELRRSNTSTRRMSTGERGRSKNERSRSKRLKSGDHSETSYRSRSRSRDRRTSRDSRDLGSDVDRGERKKIPRSEFQIYVGHFSDTSITDDQIREHFQQYGNVVGMQRPMPPYCFVRFDSLGPVEILLQKGHTKVDGQRVKIQSCKKHPRAPPVPGVSEEDEGRSIYVGKFSDISITDDHIKEHFQEYGNVIRLQRPWQGQSRAPYCFVKFDSEGPVEMLLKKGSVTVAGQHVQIKKTLRADPHVPPVPGRSEEEEEEGRRARSPRPRSKSLKSRDHSERSYRSRSRSRDRRTSRDSRDLSPDVDRGKREKRRSEKDEGRRTRSSSRGRRKKDKHRNNSREDSSDHSGGRRRIYRTGRSHHSPTVSQSRSHHSSNRGRTRSRSRDRSAESGEILELSSDPDGASVFSAKSRLGPKPSRSRSSSSGSREWREVQESRSGNRRTLSSSKSPMSKRLGPRIHTSSDEQEEGRVSVK